MAALDAIVKQTDAEPVELPRLVTANVFITYAQLGTALERATNEYQKIPSATIQSCNEHLRELVKSCESAILKANRLIEANR